MLFEDFSDLIRGLPWALTHIASTGAVSGFHCLLCGRRFTLSPVRDAPKLNGAALGIWSQKTRSLSAHSFPRIHPETEVLPTRVFFFPVL